MKQQLNHSSFSNLQDEYYEYQNSNPIFFTLTIDDSIDPLSLFIQGSSHQKQQANFSQEPQLQREAIYQEQQSSIINKESLEITCANESSSISMRNQESMSSTHQSSNQSSNNQTVPKQAKKSKRRQDNNNNAHKFFTTQLNEACKDCGILKNLKKTLKQKKIGFNKSSRQAFIIRLLQIQLIYPQMGDKINDIFLNKMIEVNNQDEKDPASLYLKKLKNVYGEAIQLFYEGKIIEATQFIYEIENAKEKTYQERGIAKVEEFMKKYHMHQ